MAKQSSTWVPKTFVRFELDEKQTAACRNWHPTFEEVDDIMLRLEDDNYKVSFSIDRYNKCAQCVLQTDANLGPNQKLLLVGRGSTPLRAFKQVFCKHTACSGEWPVPDFQINAKAEMDD